MAPQLSVVAAVLRVFVFPLLLDSPRYEERVFQGILQTEFCCHAKLFFLHIN